MQPNRYRRVAQALAAMLILWTGPALVAQTANLRGHWEFHQLRSGNRPNPFPVEGVVYRQLISLPPNTPWLRLHFTRAFLSKGSYLRIASLRDGDVQRMTQVNLEQWEFSTAFFNGNTLLLEIVAAPGSEKNYIELDKVWAGDDPSTVQPQDTICGNPDTRFPSANAAIGRLLVGGGGCTGWIIDRPSTSNNKVHLSAGHCFPGNAILQFNVPSSANNCGLVHPSANHQYAVDATTMVSVNVSIGNDYAVFRCFANPNTGLTTFQAQQVAVTLASSIPGANAALDIVGYGVDGTNTNNAAGANNSCTCTAANNTGSRNQIQQIGSGPLVNTSGTRANYQVDTCGGNSGAPVFQQSNFTAIAIHTNGGCANPVAGTSNSGTLVSNVGLQNAILTVGGGTITNDECTAATPIVDGVNGPFNNLGATTSSAFPCATGGSDIWFSYVATCSGSLTVDTCAAGRTLDTVLEVFSGFCGALTSLTCNDDSCGLGSSVTVPVTVGSLYYIRVGGFASGTGAFALTLTGCNSADDCTGAIPLHLGGNGPFTNNTATTSSPAFPCGSGNNDVWFRYDAAARSQVTFTTCNAATNFDTVIEVLTGVCGGLTSVACNDDDFSCSSSIRRSTVVASAATVTTYWVRVGGFATARGVFALDVMRAPLNDDCGNAVTVGNGVNGPFSNQGANTSLPWPCAAGGSDIWFVYTAPCNGVLIADTCSAARNYDTAIEVFRGTCGGLTSLACNDDACGLGSSVTVPVSNGQNYFIRVGGFANQRGEFELTIACRPPNDECPSAVPLVAGVNGPFSNVGATSSQPAFPCGLGGKDVWFTFGARFTSPTTFTTCTPTRTIDTVLELFSGTCGALTSLACNDDSCGLGSRVTANLVNGQTYYLRVGSFSGSGEGTFDVQVLLGTGTGSFTTLPHGCGTATIAATGNPNIGGSCTIHLQNVQGLPFMRLGFTQINQLLCPEAACRLGPGFEATVFGGTYILNIPPNPLFIGATVNFQGADLLAPGGCVNLNLTLTDTVVITVG